VKAEKTYLAIDLKSFYASVECRERKVDPLDTYLVVADEDRTDKTICLAVSPALKGFGIPGRGRLFELKERVNAVNAYRKSHAPGGEFTGKTLFDRELKANDGLELDFICAKPRMSLYVDYSTRIYNIYREFVSKDDMHVYSIDEVFIDITPYMELYRKSARKLAEEMIKKVYTETGITATAGIGSNLYLCKIAMDIEAKHSPPDENGARIAELDEYTYRERLWSHRPLTDFWRIGPGTARKLQKYGMFTMGDVARCSIGSRGDTHNEELLYKLFGINAELIIDHAWGYEPCTIKDIKSYKPINNSLSSGQVLPEPYTNEKAYLVVQEMADLLALDLVDRKVLTDQVEVYIGYDVENLNDPKRRENYKGVIEKDFYGRLVPKAVHGSTRLPHKTSSGKVLVAAIMGIFSRITDPCLLVRRMVISAGNLVTEEELEKDGEKIQLNLLDEDFGNPEKLEEELAREEKEKKRAQAVLEIRRKFGKNAVLMGMNLEEGATAKARNGMIGGHKK